jgi:UDP-N-acetylmuramoylalanine--D-glutamate ligase
MDGYARAKQAIFARQGEADTAVLGIDDFHSQDMVAALRGHPARVVTISGGESADVSVLNGVVRDAEGDIVDLAGAPALPGLHNGQNAAAATAMALALGVSRSKIAEGIRTYPGLAHRQERVGDVRCVQFVNDSKATNADSTACALACYDRVIWIAGGMAKEGGIESLARFFPKIATALLIGRDAPVLAATLAAHGVSHRDVGTLEAAVAEAWRLARDGLARVVLLSPACASWDQFTGFDQRGDRFRALVQDIAEREAA